MSSIEYLSKDRGGYGYRNFDAVLQREYPGAVQELAVSAARSHGLACAAVNVLIDREDEHFVEDVIFPFDFRRDQHVTGVNIAERMLDHLLVRHAETHD